MNLSINVVRSLRKMQDEMLIYTAEIIEENLALTSGQTLTAEGRCVAITQSVR